LEEMEISNTISTRNENKKMFSQNK
jgi:hypothetical protein